MRCPALIVLGFLAVAGCGGNQESEARAVEGEGELIPVAGDPARATYQLVEWSELPNGNREAVTRRDGSLGTSYSRREIDCGQRRSRYLGEGDSREEAEQDYPTPNEMSDLVPGSISAEIADFVCQQ